MQYQIVTINITRLFKQSTLFILFLAFSNVTISQRRDTVPVRKVIQINKIPAKIISNDKEVNKVQEPDKNVSISTNTLPDKNIISAKDTIPLRDIIQQPHVIIDKNVIDKNIFSRIKYPDTLDIGGYTIVVEKYDRGGTWNRTKTAYENLNGIGRVKMKCPSVFNVWPGIWREAVIKPVKYKVVETQSVKPNEISVTDAALIGLNTKIGQEVELQMPYYNDRVIDMSKYIDEIKKIKPLAPEGIRVRFSDCSVNVIKEGASRGIVVTGIANYPTEPAIPVAPFTLNVSSGFQLEVSAVSFSPGLDALVSGSLVLPSSIAQNNACSSGRLDLGNFRISKSCEFYKELPGNNYGVFGIGNTTLAIEGKGYVVDFSSSQSYGPSGKPNSWKGVTLMKGESKGTTTGKVISNIGYMQANYAFTNGIIESNGLAAKFRNILPYGFNAAQPFGYRIEFKNAVVNVASSSVIGGEITEGRIILPKSAVSQRDNSAVVLIDASMEIQADMDLLGNSLVEPGVSLYWGDLIAAGGGYRKSFGAENITRNALLYFSAQPVPAFNPTSSNGKKFYTPFVNINTSIVEINKMQGASFVNFQILVVNSPDIPSPLPPNSPKSPATANPIWFMLKSEVSWINVVTEGVHCNLKGDIRESPGLNLGNPTDPLYVGIKPFETLTADPLGQKESSKPFSSIHLQCVESAVINCNFSSFLNMPEPVGATYAFKEMVFTSTANNAGGKLSLQPGDSLSYWGLQLLPKPGFNSAGLISVKTGQVILTAAGLAETRHFAQPFWLTWGEMLANGSMGRLFFDYNTAGQQFDKFNFSHNAVALSDVDPDVTKKGFLRVGGTAFFPFFGGDYLHIIDTYLPGKTDAPYNERIVTLSSNSFGTSFLPTDFSIAGNWSDGLGIFNFDIKYAELSQDGFTGIGKSLLLNLLGGDLGSTLEMNSRGTCIRIGSDLMDMRSISLGPVANISKIKRIWGCVCIKNDGIENLVIGGEVTDAANVSVAARVGSYLSAILQVNPSLARITIDGEAALSLALSLDAVVNGHMQLTANFAEGFLEGEVLGKVRLAEGNPILSSSSLEAEGQFNWHLGLDFIELQGMVALKMMSSAGIPGLGAGAGMGASAAFYAGKNAPKSRAWVLMGGDPRYNLNMAPFPDRLTGIYGSLHVEQALSLFIVSGGYELTVGLGAFILEPSVAAALGALSPGIGLPYVVGKLGGRIHGEILGGLVSAGAYFNLQVLGPYPFGFEGTVGLEGCVLWVACGSVDVTIGLNTTQGFYIE